MTINRLIIIGNGFDLAHGLETSFKHFVLHYLSTVWGNLMSGFYEDRLIKIKCSSDYFKKNDLNYSNETALSIFEEIEKNTLNKPDDACMVFNSNFFKAIFKRLISINWTDIETEYFNELFSIVKQENSQNFDRIEHELKKNNQIKSLNEDLDYLQAILINYLKKQEDDFLQNGKPNDSYKDLFNEMIYEGERALVNHDLPKEIKYLNFNYTKTLLKYTNENDIINIHGTLENNPIFGFGDDTSVRYSILEDEYNNEALKKIKSFKYLDNSEYFKLVHLINHGPYQVHIYGHSCGVSDRTLFKQIFENPNCKSVKIFYYNYKDFEEKKYEISRHFNSKVDFLNKIISLDYLRTMPQINRNKTAH